MLRQAGLSSCCSESTMSLFFRNSDLNPFLDTFWTHVRFLHRQTHLTGAHLVPLCAPTEAARDHCLPSGHFLLVLRSRLLPLGCPFRAHVAPICLLSKRFGGSLPPLRDIFARYLDLQFNYGFGLAYPPCIVALHRKLEQEQQFSRNSSEEVRAAQSAAPSF